MAFYAGRFDANKIAAELGSPYSIIHPGIAVKIHPCCGLTHAPADIALELASSHDVTAGQIEEIVIFGEPLMPEVLTYHQPRTGYQGKYSMEYVVSAAIIDRQISPESFTDFQVNRPEITTLVRRVKCITRADSDWGTLRTHAWGHPAEVVIRLKDGRMVSGKAPCARGYPELPLSDEDILEKFRACTRSVLTPQATATLAERLLSLETENSIADFIGLSSADGPLSHFRSLAR
jgi:2-methylcitrate dehydratase PrpD